jgi:hypothetical protein
MAEHSAGPGFHGEPFWEPLILTPGPDDKVTDVYTHAISRTRWLAALCFGVRDESEPNETNLFPNTEAVVGWVKKYRNLSQDRPPATLLAALLPPLSAKWSQETVREAASRNELAIELGVALFERGRSKDDAFDSLPALVSWVKERSQRAAPRRDLPERVAGEVQEPPSTAANFARQPAHIDDFNAQAFEKAMEKLSKANWWERDP